MTNTDLDDFLEFSEELGMNSMLVQGAGGNSSVKYDDKLYIKASGKLLSRAREPFSFVEVNQNEIIDSLSINQELNFNSYFPNGNLRPSIETYLHSVLNYKYVFHVHCINTIVHLIQEENSNELSKKLKGLNWIKVPYIKPGFNLAKKIEELVSEENVILLESHGLLIGADNLINAKELINEVSSRLNITKRENKTINLSAIKKFSLNSLYTPVKDIEVHQIAFNDDLIRIAGSGSLYPDHVVFLGRAVKVINNQSEFTNIQISEALKPKLIIVPNMGVLTINSITKPELEMVRALFEVLMRLPNNSKVKYLSKDDEMSLLNWDAEKYRQFINE